MIKTLKKGYTMIELMVVVALIAILTVSVIGMFLSMVRGGGKAQSLALVKEEGDYAISRMERILRYAQSGCAPDGNGISFRDQFDDETSIKHVTQKIVLTSGGLDSDLTSDRVELTNIQITCYQVSGGNDRVVVSFRIRDLQHTVTEDFRASVSMRNAN